MRDNPCATNTSTDVTSRALEFSHLAATIGRWWDGGMEEGFFPGFSYCPGLLAFAVFSILRGSDAKHARMTFGTDGVVLFASYAWMHR